MKKFILTAVMAAVFMTTVTEYGNTVNVMAASELCRFSRGNVD